MAKIVLENPRINEIVYIGGAAVLVQNGVAESDDENVLAQAKAAGYKIEGAEGGDAPGEVTKEALTEVAKELGIEVKGNWGIKKLTEEIEAARAALAAQ